ncbi:MAG: ATP-binding protein [Gemmatimonadaceae bacterium]
MTAVVALLTARLGASGGAVWRVGPVGTIAASWEAGSPGASPAEAGAIASGVEATPPLFGARLASRGRTIGALTLRVHRALTDDERTLVRAVASLIAPALWQDEYQHQLENEVELRTRQIEEQRLFTEKIIDSLPVGLYVIDREYRIQAWNRKRETGMQGVSREEALGRTIFEILHRQPAAMLRREFDDAFGTGRIQQFQMESAASGDVRTYRISKIPMRLDDANVTHVITIGEDVTEWKEAQERFAQAEKLAALGTLAAGVMHEINNPLATIAACAESLVLRMDELRGRGVGVVADVGDFLKIIDDEVGRCKRIVDGLLDFSRPKQETRTRVNINAVIEKTLFLLKHHSRFKKLTVDLELDPGLGAIVEGSEEQLVQVFMALLMNGVDAMSERGRLLVRTRRESGGSPGPAVVAEVLDEGQGIPRSELTKIFEPFYTTKAPGRGTGLGLSICYGIVADHGGRMEVDSVVGKGSAFRVILPAIAARAT